VILRRQYKMRFALGDWVAPIAVRIVCQIDDRGFMFESPGVVEMRRAVTHVDCSKHPIHDLRQAFVPNRMIRPWAAFVGNGLRTALPARRNIRQCLSTKGVVRVDQASRLAALSDFNQAVARISVIDIDATTWPWTLAPALHAVLRVSKVTVLMYLHSCALGER